MYLKSPLGLRFNMMSLFRCVCSLEKLMASELLLEIQEHCLLLTIDSQPFYLSLHKIAGENLPALLNYYKKHANFQHPSNKTVCIFNSNSVAP